MGTALQTTKSVLCGLALLLILGTVAEARVADGYGQESESMDSIPPETYADAKEEVDFLESEYDSLMQDLTRARAVLGLNPNSKSAKAKVFFLERNRQSVVKGLAEATDQMKRLEKLESAKKRGAAVAVQSAKPKGVTTTAKPKFELEQGIYESAYHEDNPRSAQQIQVRRSRSSN